MCVHDEEVNALGCSGDADRWRRRGVAWRWEATDGRPVYWPVPGVSLPRSLQQPAPAPLQFSSPEAFNFHQSPREQSGEDCCTCTCSIAEDGFKDAMTESRGPMKITHLNSYEAIVCNCEENGSMVLRSNFCWYYANNLLVAYKQFLQIVSW